jgi:hypothetical protein
MLRLIAVVTCCIVLLLSSLKAAKAQTTAPGAAVAAADDQLINQILALLDGAAITRLDAKLSLESFKLSDGRVELRGVRLENFNLGLRLKPKAAQKLFDIAKQRLSPEQKQEQQQVFSMFDLLKLGLFQDVEIGIHLDEFKIGLLIANAKELDVEGLVLRASTGTNSAPIGTTKGSARDDLLQILRRAILQQIEVHAALNKLSARRINAQVREIGLAGLRIGVALRRTS